MKFLKTNIFYPKNVQITKEQITLMKKLQLEYEQTLSINCEKINRNLFEFYVNNDRLHDFKIIDIYYKLNDIIIKIKDPDNSNVYILIFLNVSKFIIKQTIHKVLFDIDSDITLCEIGFVNKCNYLGVHTSDDLDLEISFNGFDITIS